MSEPTNRTTIRERLQDFGERNIGKYFGSRALHFEFGSALRTRIWELNQDPACPVEFVNETKVEGFQERSVYFVRLKQNSAQLTIEFAEARA